MKKVFATFTVIFVLGIAGPVTWTPSQVAWADAEQSSEKAQSFTIEKMTCAMCPITVRKAMEWVDGVYSVTVDYDTKTAVAVFDPARTTAKAIAEASSDVGYPATPVGK